jgi:glycolate oxidase
VHVDELAALLPPGAVLTDPASVAAYRHDWARDPAAETPAAVVRARSTADVSTVLRWACARAVPVVPRGAGSSLSGGASGVAGGITLSLELMREVTVDPANRLVVAQPGAITADVKAAAAEHGLWYPPDPSSFELSSIGGNVATNAGGLCCVKYGVTADYVLGAEVVLADGTVVRLGGATVKDVAGLPLLKLFVGSEGILGVITEVTLRLLPPVTTSATTVAVFHSVAAAAEAVVAITRRIRPSVVELMDHTTINAVEDAFRMGLDRQSGALVILRSDAPGDAAAAETAVIEAECRAQGAEELYTTTDPDEGDAFMHARRSALPALERLGPLLIEDVGVPLPALPALVAGIGDIAEARATRIALMAHAGDGNTHPVIVHEAGNEDARTRALLAFDDVMALAIGLGGTITGEHGVGRLKASWLSRQLGDDVVLLTKRVKDALDPTGVLNPGVLLR